MPIPTEPIGSIPRPRELVEALSAGADDGELAALYEEAVRDTIARFEEVGSPVVTDGEQRKSSFATYPLEHRDGLAPDGVVIPFEDGHTRQLPRLTSGPFRYGVYADTYLEGARRYATRPVKQAVISASALSLLYPDDGIEGYPRSAFLADLVREAETDVRRCLQRGAATVQIDFTEARLSLKLDPSGALLKDFVDLNNDVLERFDESDRRRIGVHTCPGGDLDATHSADVDYADLLPTLFELRAGAFYVQLASEPDRRKVLELIRECAEPLQRIFVGVIDPLDPEIEAPEQVCDRVLEAAEYIPLDRLGSTDDCGFSPFADDTSTARDVAFEKIRARVTGTDLAAKVLSGARLG
jgi:5-methyltetrahydropteroyltriglutamate--homocysteine methyltransferase